MKSIICLILGLSITAVLSAQSIAPDVIASSGGYVEQGGVSLSWTLGEPVTETFTDGGGNNTLTQGFQQSNYTIVAVEELLQPGFSINVYPNPTADFINIDWILPEKSDVMIELYDMHGRKMVEKSLPGAAKSVQVDMKKLAAATYILKAATTDGKLMKKFSIVKNQ